MARAASLRSRVDHDPADGREWLLEALRALDDAHAELQAAQDALNEQANELFQTRVDHELAWQRYRDLFEAAPIAYLETDPCGVVVEANRRCCELLRSRPSLLVDRPLSSFVACADRELFRRSLDALARGSKRSSLCLALQPRHAGAAVATRVEVARVDNPSGGIQALRWTFSLIVEATKSPQFERADSGTP